MKTDDSLQLAYDFVQSTGEHIFLTGKAGTGKTTFLRSLKERLDKQMVILAPTGVAAINAGGMTIHSFFQLPFGPYVASPSSASSALSANTPSGRSVHRLRKEKIALIRSLNLLIIDEISMVRADLLDAVNDMLCRYRRDSRPFGGVQLLMIGDVQQLAPIAKEDEWELLSKEYDTPYFFSCKALKKTHYITISLQKVFRQSDDAFLKILNSIRDNSIDQATLSELNKRYLPDFCPPQKDKYITLTTHNYQAQAINEQELAAIKHPVYSYSAEVTGNFPEGSFPTGKELILKKGAQVMFVKNDTSGERRFYNGKIGEITGLSKDYITVLPENEKKEIMVEKEEWMNTRYTLDPETKEISEEVEGVFKQYPLKLAWAITVHKSQGLTFEHAIIDAAEAFAYGQVYVALSRCKTLDGMVLKKPIGRSAIKEDAIIRQFNKEVQEHQPSEKDFYDAKKQYFAQLLFDLFNFQKLESYLRHFKSQSWEYLRNLYPDFYIGIEKATNSCYKEITEVGFHFQKQLQDLIEKADDYEHDQTIRNRIQKASLYFGQQIKEQIETSLPKSLPEIDNQEGQKLLKESLNKLSQECILKRALIDSVSDGFSILTYLKAEAKTLAEIEETAKKPVSSKKKSAKEADLSPKEKTLTNDIQHPQLYQQLAHWRYQEAQEREVPAYVILPQSAILGIAQTLPGNAKELKKIRGIGAKTIEKYGSILLEIVEEYIFSHSN